MAQTGKILADIYWLGIIAESDDEVESAASDVYKRQGIEHVANMREKIGTGYA